MVSEEWYGEDIPKENYEADDWENNQNNEAEGAQQELEQMKAKLKEMEAEAARIKKMQDSSGNQGEQSPMGSDEKEEGGGNDGDNDDVDKRSIYIGNVDYSATPEELQQHFSTCGTVNRLTIQSDKFGNPKGYAYLEFLEPSAVEAAMLMNGSELRGRQLKVNPKRTNLPGFKRARHNGFRGRGHFRGGRHSGRGGGGGGMGFFVPYPMMYPQFGRGRGRGRGRSRGRYYFPY